MLALVCTGCGDAALTVQYRVTPDYRFSLAERRTIDTIARRTAREVRRLLPSLPDDLVLDVQAGTEVLDATGASAEAGGRYVYWSPDPNYGEGVAAIAERHLRPTLFHEFHHLAREAAVGTPETLMDRVIVEGMANVFGRDFGGASYPWADYPANVSDWVTELLAQPPTQPTAERQGWLSRHPDGRRWIGHRAGTYLVDRAVRASGKTSAELTSTSTEEVVRMALDERP